MRIQPGDALKEIARSPPDTATTTVTGASAFQSLLDSQVAVSNAAGMPIEGEHWQKRHRRDPATSP